MKREEAITELKDLKDYCRSTFLKRTCEAYTKAIDKGIEAIENQKSVIEELEMMWEKIRALPDINPDYPMDKTIHISRYEVQEIVYERISELKGEKE